MSHILKAAVLHLSAGHRHKETTNSLDNLQIPDHETIIEGYGNKKLSISRRRLDKLESQ
jgi:hypothetical protein